MATGSHRVFQDDENVAPFPEGGNRANNRKFEIEKSRILAAVRADTRIPPRSRASVQNYAAFMIEGANRRIFNATRHLVTWIGTLTAAKRLATTEHTILRARRILEELGYCEIIAYGAAGRGNSNLCRVLIPCSENLSREDQKTCCEIAKNLSWRPRKPVVTTEDLPEGDLPDGDSPEGDLPEGLDLISARKGTTLDVVDPLRSATGIHSEPLLKSRVNTANQTLKTEATKANYAAPCSHHSEGHRIHAGTPKSDTTVQPGTDLSPPSPL